MSDVLRLEWLHENVKAAKASKRTAERMLRMAHERVSACHEMVHDAERRLAKAEDDLLKEKPYPVGVSLRGVA